MLSAHGAADIHDIDRRFLVRHSCEQTLGFTHHSAKGELGKILANLEQQRCKIYINSYGILIMKFIKGTCSEIGSIHVLASTRSFQRAIT